MDVDLFGALPKKGNLNRASADEPKRQSKRDLNEDNKKEDNEERGQKEESQAEECQEDAPQGALASSSSAVVLTIPPLNACPTSMVSCKVCEDCPVMVSRGVLRDASPHSS